MPAPRHAGTMPVNIATAKVRAVENSNTREFNPIDVSAGRSPGASETF
jgi:hypothetical protein